MLISTVIRGVTSGDVPAVTALLRELGYSAERDRVASTLQQILDDSRALVFVAADDVQGVVGLLSLSCRPVLRRQGVAGTIEELVVRADAAARASATVSSSTPRVSRRSAAGSVSRRP